MTLAMERKRSTSPSLYCLLLIKAVIVFCISNKSLINTKILLLVITKIGKKYISRESSHKLKGQDNAFILLPLSAVKRGVCCFQKLIGINNYSLNFHFF